MTDLGTSQRNLTAFSTKIDRANAHRDPEAQLWGRVSKIAEEHGEVIAALIGMLGANPRKGITHTTDDIITELLDVAVTALGAIEHITGNDGTSLNRLLEKIDAVATRAGVVPKPAQHAIEDGQLICLGDDSSDCWNWPDCECDTWELGDDGEHIHPPVPQGRCWMLDWVNATELDNTYDGEERFDGFPDGPVTAYWTGDFVQWKYQLVVDNVSQLPWFGSVLTASEEYLTSVPPVMWPSWYRAYREDRR